MVVLEVPVAVAAAALALEAERYVQIVDEENPLPRFSGMGLTLAAADREYHRVDRATLIAAVIPVPPP